MSVFDNIILATDSYKVPPAAARCRARRPPLAVLPRQRCA